MDFSRAYCLLIASSGSATSMSFLDTGVLPVSGIVGIPRSCERGPLYGGPPTRIAVRPLRRASDPYCHSGRLA